MIEKNIILEIMYIYQKCHHKISNGPEINIKKSNSIISNRKNTSYLSWKSWLSIKFYPSSPPHTNFIPLITSSLLLLQ